MADSTTTVAAEQGQPSMTAETTTTTTTTTKYTVASTLADPQYKAGRKLIDDGRLEEAVNFFSGLLETRVAVLSGDEMNPSLAPLYYEYGNSLLYNAEESGAVFGDAITDAEKKKAMAIVEAQVGGDGGAQGEEGGARAGGAQGGGAGDEGEQAPSPDQEAEEDLEIAWENLEMARRIYNELELTEEIRTAFAKVSWRMIHMRRPDQYLNAGDTNYYNEYYYSVVCLYECNRQQTVVVVQTLHYVRCLCRVVYPRGLTVAVERLAATVA